MDYKGVIIEESLDNSDVLKSVKIERTEVEPVTERHKTPWLRQWTLHTIGIPEMEIDQVAEAISKALDRRYWYADFKNESIHYIIFRDKIFKVDRSKPDQYSDVTHFGISLGIPEYQLDFSPAIEEWKR